MVRLNFPGEHLRSGKAPGINEIQTEMLKALGVEGLSWLTHQFNIVLESGTMPKGWQTGVVVPLYKKGDQRVCANYRGITVLSLPGTALHTSKDPGGGLRVCPSGLHVFCGSGEGV